LANHYRPRLGQVKHIRRSRTSISTSESRPFGVPPSDDPPDRDRLKAELRTGRRDLAPVCAICVICGPKNLCLR